MRGDDDLGGHFACFGEAWRAVVISTACVGCVRMDGQVLGSDLSNPGAAPRIVVITLFAFPALECSGSGCLNRFWGSRSSSH